MTVAAQGRQATVLNSFQETKYAPTEYTLKTGVTIFAGTMIGLFISGGDIGKVAPAADDSDMIVLGVNKGLTLIQADTAKLNAFDIERGIVELENDTGTAVVANDVNKQLFVVDDQTVSTATGVNSIEAGICRGLGETLAGNVGVYSDFSVLQR